MYRYREATYENELRHIFPELDADQRFTLAGLVELAIRTVAQADGAPARCRRRECRKSGECCQCGLGLDEPVCHTFLPDHAGESVRAMLLYADAIGRMKAGSREDGDDDRDDERDGEFDLPIAKLTADPRMLRPLGPFRAPIGLSGDPNRPPKDYVPLA